MIRKKIFTNSMSDFFHERGDVYRPWAWRIIKKHNQYDWQILTKRPERISSCLPPDWNDGWKQVWIGISAENNEVCEERFNALKTVPGYIKFASVEPLLEQINLRPYLQDIQWVIVGGESGNDYGAYRYRPCKIEWIEDVVNQCREAVVPVFVKQLGTYLHHQMKLSHWYGGNINEFPEQLKIRQFPIPVIK
jgi:protein gp37